MRNGKVLWSVATLLFWAAASSGAHAAACYTNWLIVSGDNGIILKQDNGFTVEINVTGNEPGNIRAYADYYPTGHRDQKWVHGDLGGPAQLIGNHLISSCIGRMDKPASMMPTLIALESLSMARLSMPIIRIAMHHGQRTQQCSAVFPTQSQALEQTTPVSQFAKTRCRQRALVLYE